MAGTLFVVATPIGNLEDITARALRVLREVALIAAEDTRRTGHLLARYGISTPTTSLHEHNERGKSETLLARLAAGESIAIVSDAGTPTISDPGSRLVALAMERGIRVEPIPGPSAVMAALSVSGFAAGGFTFLGFPPTRSKDRKLWLTKLISNSGTVVFYEAPHRIRATLQEIRLAAGDCRVVIARELTKAHEELVIGPISTALERLKAPRGEFTVVLEIGQTKDISLANPAWPADIAAEFGRLTKYETKTKREAIAQLSRRHGLSANAVYAALEAARKSVG
jgi:16S rRNA (cytidine1402-2'-O)-methyltransferase